MKLELGKSIDELLLECPQRLSGSSRKELRNQVPNQRGVYLIFKKGESKPLYIGSAGKFKKGKTWGKSTIRSRMFAASTPYHFGKKSDNFYYGPTSTGVPPAGYHNSLPYDSIEIIAIPTVDPIVPSVLEHLLIQGFINQYGDLPEANQKI